MPCPRASSLLLVDSSVQPPDSMPSSRRGVNAQPARKAVANLVSSRLLVTSNLRLRKPTTASAPIQKPVPGSRPCAEAACAARLPRSANAATRVRMTLILEQPEPLLAPLQRGFLRQDAARRVVLVPLADALRPQRREQVVEFPAAEIEGLRI